MFFLCAVVATLFYALNNVLLAPLVRKKDPLLICAYRGLSLGLTMLPFIFLMVRVEDFQAINFELILILLFTSAVTVIGNVSFNTSIRFLPVGIASPVCLGFSTIVGIFIGVFFLGERVSITQLSLVALILVETVIMGIVSRKGTFEGLDLKRGLLYCILFGFCLGSAYALVAVASRKINPVVVAYCWEFGVGIVGIIAYEIINFSKRGQQENTKGDFTKVLLAASPTAVASVLYAIAATLGPVGLLTAILTLVGAFTAFFCHLILKEKLNSSQWLMILVLVSTLAILKLVSV